MYIGLVADYAMILRGVAAFGVDTPEPTKIWLHPVLIDLRHCRDRQAVRLIRRSKSSPISAYIHRLAVASWRTPDLEGVITRIIPN